MGADESKVDPSQVPGFNPDVQVAGKKRQQAWLKHGAPLQQGNGKHGFFQYADVSDHIRPIYEDSSERVREKNLDEGVEGTVNLTKLLDELSIKGRKKSDSEISAMEFPEHDGGSETDSDDNSEVDADEDRGMYHHEVKEEHKEAPSVYSAAAHPISLKGDFSIGEVITCEDMSTWAVQYPIYRISWFLGAEVGNQTAFGAIPVADGSSFKIPLESVGKYIEVVATRRVEDQLRGTYERNVEGGVYDPHIKAARHTEIGIEANYTDVSSTAVIGPIQISDTYSYSLMRALGEKSFQCHVKLRDELLEAQEGFDYVKGESSCKVPALLVVNRDFLEFQYNTSDIKKRKVGSSTLFAFEWLVKLLGYGEKDESLHDKAERLTGTVTAHLKMTTLAFRLAYSKRKSTDPKTIIVATKPRKKDFRHQSKTSDLIRFDVQHTIGRDALFYILLGFQAVQRLKEYQSLDWNHLFQNGQVEKGKELIQRYIQEVASTAVENAPAYEEMPEDPWNY